MLAAASVGALAEILLLFNTHWKTNKEGCFKAPLQTKS